MSIDEHLAAVQRTSRFAAARKVLDWSRQQIATKLGCGPALVQQWENGKCYPHECIVDWLEILAVHHKHHPPPRPEEWRTQSLYANRKEKSHDLS